MHRSTGVLALATALILPGIPSCSGLQLRSTADAPANVNRRADAGDVPRAGSAPAQPAHAGRAPREDASDEEVLEAVEAVERAATYRDLADTVERFAPVLASRRTVVLVDRALENASAADQRGTLALERQLSLDTRQHGPARATRLLAVRLIAASALAAESPEQFATFLDAFAPLAPEMDEPLVRAALETPANTWPEGLRPLLVQLARDWRAEGARIAAARMAQAAGGGQRRGPDPAGAGGGGSSLAGHWRSTRIVFDSPTDEHLVLRADGSAETWTVTAGGSTPPVRGRWTAREGSLTVTWADGDQWSQPFTFHEGSLVFPNVQGRRQFWERLQ
jgi:hypothetical protein